MEAPFPNDGWSGATLTALHRGQDRFILKRTSAAKDWIVRGATPTDTVAAILKNAGVLQGA